MLIYIYIYIYMCVCVCVCVAGWWISSLEIDTGNRVQILDEALRNSHSPIALGRGMHPTLFSPSMCNSLTRWPLSMATSLQDFKLDELCLKLALCHLLLEAEDYVNIRIYIYICLYLPITLCLSLALSVSVSLCLCHYLPLSLYIYIPDIGLGVRVFANCPGDLGSIPGRVIPKTQKMVLDASLLNTQYYKVRIKGKVEQSREGVAPSPTPWCGSYRKGSLRVTLDYGRQLYFYLYIYIYIYIAIFAEYSIDSNKPRE